MKITEPLYFFQQLFSIFNPPFAKHLFEKSGFVAKCPLLPTPKNSDLGKNSRYRNASTCGSLIQSPNAHFFYLFLIHDRKNIYLY